MKTSLIIPTLNEEESIRFVLSEIPKEQVTEIIVVDGGSIDDTVEIALASGARVTKESRRGYGRACATGVEQAKGDILVFLDADGADNPAKIQALINPIITNNADMVLGSRLAGGIQPGAMPWQQYFGNWLFANMIRILFGLPITDLSPFRAIKKSTLLALDMVEMTYGWPTEMIVKAFRQGLRIIEIPVNYRPRYGGQSKISGTLRGTVLSAYFIFSTILRSTFKSSKQSK